MASAEKRVLIIGANFAGLAAAKAFDDRFRVTVVDASPSFEFLPNIHELISGHKRPSLLRLDRKRLIERAGHRMIVDKVTALDYSSSRVTTASGRVLEYDACILAVGGVNQTHGIPGAAEHGLPLKTVADGAHIRKRLARVIETENEPAITIVGGGLEGVESLGEVLRAYRRVPALEIHLVEAEDQLMPEEPGSLDREIRHRVRQYPVIFHTGVRVVEVTAESVLLDSGKTISSDLVIWTGGAAPNPLLADAGLSEPGAWVPVSDSLQCRAVENIFVAGDAASLAEPLTKQAYHALDMGTHAARNAKRCLVGKRLRRFSPLERPRLISLGDLETYMVMGRLVMAGKALGALKEAVYQYNMTKSDPPLAWPSLIEGQARLWTGFANLVLPRMLAPHSLPELARLRLVS